ncbi:MAG: hypothetical protein ACAI43_10455 [Phycisphaerae bacterium]|nr:hypothetical protein [Tepidisphaeraceae bacterium]
MRLAVFAQNRALWLDEAMLANNIVDRAPAALLQPLADDQAAPVGFLMLEKAVISVFGPGERPLRAVPLAGGILCLLCLMLLVRRVADPRAGLIALALAAVCGPLIYYASEVKQYSTDAACAALLLVIGWPLTRPDGLVSTARATGLASAGAVAVWISYPVAFVLAGVGALGLGAARGDRKRQGMTIAIGAAWLLSFAALYVVSLRHLVGHTGLRGYWQNAFPPLSPAAVPWAYRTALGIMRSPVGLSAAALAVVCCVVGGRSVWTRDRSAFALLVAPVAFAFLAALFRRYPFEGRVMLFVVPALLVLIAHGVGWLWALPGGRGRLPAIVALALLAFYPLRLSAALVGRTAPPPEVLAEAAIPPREQLRDVLAQVRARARDGDRILVYPLARPAFTFYTSRDPIHPGAVPAALRVPRSAADARRLVAEHDGARRLWVVFSHVLKGPNAVDDESLTLLLLDDFATRIEEVRSDGASAYLYALPAPFGGGAR